MMKSASRLLSHKLWFTVCLWLAVGRVVPAVELPNVIVVLVDDMGLGDTTATNPNCKIPTPNLQRMADEGLTFLDAHTPSSVCTPTRYGLVTGRYNWRSRLGRGVLSGTSEHLIPAERPTIGHLMRRAGYHTAMIGKWHLGWDWPRTNGEIDFTQPVKNGPDINGFDRYYAHCGSLDMPPYVWVDTGRITAQPDREEGVTREQDRYGWYRSGPIGADFHIEKVLPHLFDKAMDHIHGQAEAAKSGHPFFLYLALPAPHTPIVPVAPFKAASGLNPYADFVMQLDHHVGALFSTLKQAGLDDNTLVIFTSDNGCSPEANFELLTEQGHDPSAGFRGHKADIYEGGHRVPLIARWPGRIAPKRKTHALACLTDIYATLESIAEQPRQVVGGEDSFSLLPILDGAESSGRDSLISHSISGEFAVRQGPWKLCLCAGSGGWSAPREDAAKQQRLPAMQLFNLADDPGEQKNLVAEQPAKVDELLFLLKEQVERGRCTPGDATPNDREIHFLPRGEGALAFAWNQPTFWETQDGSSAATGWDFEEQEIRLARPGSGRGNLLSPPMPKHFELSFEWKITAKTNSGLKYRVREYGSQWLGIEYQIIDEPIPLPAPHKGSTASIYDIVAPSLDKSLKPAGEWNQAKIVAQGERVEHYLNGALVASAVTNSPTWEAQIARSKFYGRDGFGQPSEGDRVMLTDHGGQAAYRNFRLVELPAPAPSTPPTEQVPQLGNGLRNSWADQTSIVLWTRTTARANMVLDGPHFVPIDKEQQTRLAQSRDAQQLLAVQLPANVKLEQMFGANPGVAGEVRLSYFSKKNGEDEISTSWSTTTAENDFTHQWSLSGLSPGIDYVAIVEARPIGQTEPTAVLRGSFKTAPPVDNPTELTFCMTTCHDFPRRDDGLNGHKIYPAMTSLDPDFVVHAGDIEYYDKADPWAWTVDLMRFKWARIFSLPNNRRFYSNRTTYFLKDDHDTLKNDCWSGQMYGAVSFEEGVRIFNKEQFPSHAPRYKTVSWGPAVQVWFLEGRDYRSPNSMPDGPGKTILGQAQKHWLFQTLADSKATFKLIFSPTPIVGPDRGNKHDNHSNDNFVHEGQELRKYFGQVEGAIVFCGDRHWQYASVDDENGLWEFGCGPGSEKHQLGWKPGDVRPEHRFLRVEGGFLSGAVKLLERDRKPQLILRHHSVTGEAVSEFQF